MWMAYGAARLDTDTEYNKNVGGHITRHAHCRQVIKRTRANQRTRPHMFSPCREGQKRKTIMVSYRGLTRAYRGTGVKEECKALDMIWIGKRGLHLVMEEERTYGKTSPKKVSLNTCHCSCCPKWFCYRERKCWTNPRVGGKINHEGKN